MSERSDPIKSYLAVLSDEQRSALERLRKIIRNAAPRAEECISYGLPAFRQEGRALVAYGATAHHCSFHPLSPAVIRMYASELARFDTSKGTIRFHQDRPLPVTLVRKIVKARIVENSKPGPKRFGGAARAK
jgi:uncharacterized protein YdhG (YjbR/CyaY superfamily)